MDLLLRILYRSFRENLDDLHRSEAERDQARLAAVMDDAEVDLRLV